MLADHSMVTVPADVYRAQGALAERLDVDLPVAAEALRAHAADRSITLVEAAHEVLHRGARPLAEVVDPWGSC
jgi:hypothetical protein